VALLLQQIFVVFDDLSDPLQVGPIFALGRGSCRR
jgi:hypothetical protein